MVVLAILVAACAGEAVGETTTTSQVVDSEPTTTTTVVETTTTTEAVAPVDVCRGGIAVVWKPGHVYVADCFLVPVSFAPIDPGWRTFRVEDDRFLVTLADGVEPAAEVAFLGYRPTSGLDSLVESIVALEGLTVVLDRKGVRVDGRPAVTFDVESAPDPDNAGTGECFNLSLGTVLGGNGWPLMGGALGESGGYGFGPCRTFRVWVVDVAGAAITLIAAADEKDVLYESMPTIERLLDSVTFEAP